MTEGGEVVPGAEVGGEQVAGSEGEAAGEAESGDGFLGDGEDFRPVDGGDGDVWGSLGKSDAPDAGAGGEVEDADRGGGGGKAERGGEGLGSRVAHGEDVDDKLAEEFAAVRLLIDVVGGLAGGDDLVEVEEFGEQLLAGVEDDAALEAGFAADEEERAFRGEGVEAGVVFGEEFEADEGVHDGGEAAGGGAGGGGNLGESHCAGVEDVEDVVADGGFHGEGWDVSPGELHDAFRRNGRGAGGCDG